MPVTQRWVGRGIGTTLTATASTVYASPFHWHRVASASDFEQEEVLVPIACSLRNFFLSLETAPGSGKTRTFTIQTRTLANYLLGNPPAATAMTFSIADLATTGSYTGADIVLAAETLVSVAVSATGGTPAASKILGFRIDSVGTAAGEQWYGTPSGAELLEAAPGNVSLNGVFSHYNGGFLDSAFNDRYPRDVVALPCSITGLWFGVVGGTPGGGKSYTTTIHLSGSAVGSTAVTVADSDQEGSASFTLNPAQGSDYLFVRCVPSGTPTALPGRISVKVVSSIDGQSQWSSNSGGSLETIGPNWGPPRSSGQLINALTEAAAQFEILGPDIVQVVGMWVQQVRGSNGNSYRFRKNNADAIVVAPINFDGAGAFVPASPVSLGEGDIVSHEWTRGTFVTTGNGAIGLVVYATSTAPEPVQGKIGPYVWVRKTRRIP